MTKRSAIGSIVLGISVMLGAACAGVPSGSSTEQVAAKAASNRVLVLPVTREVTALLPAMNSSGGSDATLRLFNAGFTVTDDAGAVHSELADVPQLNTDTWRVLPDGKMETTYKLKPNLTWHDGTPLEADDFVFAKRFYANPGVEVTRTKQERLMESVVAIDPRTVLIRWAGPYAGANALKMGDLDPLPRHVLAQPFASLEQNSGEAESFRNLPYWKAEYIGVGPYRLEKWEPGSHFEAVAFDRFALGRPKIERVINRIMDDTAIMTHILAGTVDVGEMNFEHIELLRRDWVREGKGILLTSMGNVQPNEIQLRPEYVGHPALLDVRVRRALAHSLDRQAINEGAFDSQGFMAEGIVPSNASFYPEADRAIFHYPYDPRRSEQLMNEAGFVKDREGMFVDAAGERFVLDFERNTASDRARLQLIMVDTWQRAGFQIRAYALPVGAPRESRYTFPGIQGQGSANEGTWATANIGSAQNRWNGGNRSGFSNVDYDRLYDAFNTTLDQAERTRQFIGMQRIYTEYMPTFITHFSINSWAVGSALRGPKGETKPIGDLTSGTLRYFNIHEWSWN